jgi:hypothetical protein
VGPAGADDHLSVGTAEGGGERSRKALSGEIWVIPPSPPRYEEAAVPTTPAQKRATALDPTLPVASSSPFKTTVDSSPVSIPEAVKQEAGFLIAFEGPSATSAGPEATETSATSSGRGIVRSESHDRRLNEAAQFAEAVGEPELSVENYELRIIEEDRDDDGGYADDSDDDDDATEINVEGMTEDDVRKQQHQRKVGMELDRVPGMVVSIHRDPKQPPALHKARPQWPFKTKRTKGGFLDKLPENGTFSSQDFVYKGIRANPPEIVSRGVTRGNYSCLHRKAWLECTDKYRTCRAESVKAISPNR